MNAWLKRWLRWEIGLPFAMLVCLGILVASEVGQSRIRQGYEQITGELETTTKLTRLVGMLSEVEASQRGFLLTNRASYLAAYEETRPRINTLILDLRDAFIRFRSKEDLDKLSALVAVTREKLSEIDLTIQLAKQGKKSVAEDLVLTDIGKEKMDQVHALVASLQAESRVATLQSLSDWQFSRNIARGSVAVIALINFAILLMLFRRLRADWARERGEQQRLKDDQARLDRLVEERTEQLGILASHLQEVSETEKTTLARDLHDELGAILTAIKMDVAWVKGRLSADQAALAEKLARATRNLDGAVQAKRRIIENLRPSTLITLGLVTALRELAEQMQSHAGWRLELELPEESPDIGRSASIALFRIAQESLNNAAKYAEAAHVRLALASAPEAIELEIRDDGKGFAEGSVRPKAHGIAGMRQRMHAFKGRLEVRTAPGAGTTVRAVIPLTTAVGAPA